MKKKSMLAALVMLSLLQGSVYAEDLYGDGNSLVVNAGETYDNIYGVGKIGFTEDVSGGSVTVDGGTWNYMYGGYTENGSAINNSVTINGSEEEPEKYHMVYGASAANGDIKGNIVDFNNGYSILVMAANLTDAQKGEIYEVSGNIVNINGGLVQSASAAYAIIYKDKGANVIVKDNHLNVQNASIYASVVGAISNNYVSGTVVTFSENSTIYGNVVAGGCVSTEAEVIDNDIKLTSNANVSNALLNGYYATKSNFQNPDTHSDNSLIVDGWTG